MYKTRASGRALAGLRLITRFAILLNVCFAFVVRLLGGKWRAVRLTAAVAAALEPVLWIETRNGRIGFHAPGEIPIWRAQLLLTKEPETIAWMDQFLADDVLWDIGANVGSYTLYAARKGCRVIAMEPSAGNYDLLVRNITLNDLEKNITALCIAVHDTTKGGFFYMKANSPGIAESSFETGIDSHGEAFAAGHREYVFGYSLADLAANSDFGFPNHIKIDVDGNEAQIIKGGAGVLADRRLRTVLMELDISRSDYCLAVAGDLRAAGLVSQDLDQDFPWSLQPMTRNFIFARES